MALRQQRNRSQDYSNLQERFAEIVAGGLLFRSANLAFEVMSLLKKNPDANEIVVQKAERLRYATEAGKFGEVFESYNLEYKS